MGAFTYYPGDCGTCGCPTGECARSGWTTDWPRFPERPGNAEAYMLSVPRARPRTWASEAAEYLAWAKSLIPLVVAGPPVPWRSHLVPRLEAVVPLGHPNPHRARWS